MKIIPRICPVCGKEFFWKHSSQKYCTRECAYKSPNYKTPHNWHGRKVNPNKYKKIVCQVCGIEKTVLKYRKTKYCSNKCRHIGSGKTQHENRNAVTPHRQSSYRGGNWKKQRRLARERDNYTCQICGKQQKQTTSNSRIISVHHIIPYKDFNGDYKKANQLSNLICLCTKCHALVEHHKIPLPS